METEEATVKLVSRIGADRQGGIPKFGQNYHNRDQTECPKEMVRVVCGWPLPTPEMR